MEPEARDYNTEPTFSDKAYLCLVSDEPHESRNAGTQERKISRENRHSTQDKMADRAATYSEMFRAFKGRVSKIFSTSPRVSGNRYPTQNTIREDARANMVEQQDKSQTNPQQDQTEARFECVSCLIKFQLSKITRVPCSHIYCKDCITKMFELFTKRETPLPPQCCGKQIEKLDDCYTWGLKIARSHQDRIVEFKDTNKLYCSNPSCSQYIPPRKRSRRVGVCEHCMTRTCKSCGVRGHFGPCQEESIKIARGIKSTNKAEVTTSEVITENAESLAKKLEASNAMNDALLERLAIKNKWKRCPSCTRMIERRSGCTLIS